MAVRIALRAQTDARQMGVCRHDGVARMDTNFVDELSCSTEFIARAGLIHFQRLLYPLPRCAVIDAFPI